ncbi:hypothetical protein BHM03_00033123 [Ensete ventricosum]|nr:hypothetical protein BHM03_00033123 [Ensete ventricosum]
MIDEAEGLEKIENLQSHDNTEIYEKAVKILETFWLEEEDDAMPTGDAAETGFHFGNNGQSTAPSGSVSPGTRASIMKDDNNWKSLQFKVSGGWGRRVVSLVQIMSVESRQVSVKVVQ